VKIDLSRAMEAVDGDRTLLKELISDFMNDYPRQLEHIRSVVESGDAEQVERFAHGLKGSIGVFGAQEAYHLAYQLECMGKKGELSGADAILRRFEQEVQELVLFFDDHG